MTVQVEGGDRRYIRFEVRASDGRSIRSTYGPLTSREERLLELIVLEHLQSDLMGPR